MKIIICGGPKTGKTTLAEKLAKEHNLPIRHTDDLISTHKWSEDSEEVKKWIEDKEDCIIEGVTAHRGIRKWKEANKGNRLDAQVIFLDKPHQKLDAKQEALLKGIRTQWSKM